MCLAVYDCNEMQLKLVNELYERNQRYTKKFDAIEISFPYINGSKAFVLLLISFEIRKFCFLNSDREDTLLLM